MASDMMDALMELCQEKHIDELELIDRLEKSLAESYAKLYKIKEKDPESIEVIIDRQSGDIYIYLVEPVDDSMITIEGDPHEGEYTEFTRKDITPRTDDQKANLSRSAAKAAKEVINDMVRHSGREEIYKEFSSRIGDIITGTVLHTVPDFTIVKIRDGVEAELPHFPVNKCFKTNEKTGETVQVERNERPADERYSHNQRIKAIIIDVRNPDSTAAPVRGEKSRPNIIISRTTPELIRRLFELEVPEIYDGIVEIKSIAREPGKRSKVAVASLDDRLDPVGACVGPKGSRVRTVVSELQGERVDVVLWSDDMEKCVANALSPAKVTRVIIDHENNHATVIVPDDQLSLAIGQAGQNARLAARLTGMHIDIKNEKLAAEVLASMPVVEEAEDLLDEGEAHRCEYVGSNGIQCRNMARPGSHYCGLHESLAAAGDVEVSDDPDSLI